MAISYREGEICLRAEGCYILWPSVVRRCCYYPLGQAITSTFFFPHSFCVISRFQRLIFVCSYGAKCLGNEVLKLCFLGFITALVLYYLIGSMQFLFIRASIGDGDGTLLAEARPHGLGRLFFMS